MYNLLNSEQSHFTDDNCCFALDLSHSLQVDDLREGSYFDWVIDRPHLGNKTFPDKCLLLLLSSFHKVPHCISQISDIQDKYVIAVIDE